MTTEVERLATLETQVIEHERRLNDGAEQMKTFLWFQVATLVSTLGGLAFMFFEYVMKVPK